MSTILKALRKLEEKNTPPGERPLREEIAAEEVLRRLQSSQPPRTVGLRTVGLGALVLLLLGGGAFAYLEWGRGSAAPSAVAPAPASDVAGIPPAPPAEIESPQIDPSVEVVERDAARPRIEDLAPEPPAAESRRSRLEEWRARRGAARARWRTLEREPALAPQAGPPLAPPAPAPAAPVAPAPPIAMPGPAPHPEAQPPAQLPPTPAPVPPASVAAAPTPEAVVPEAAPLAVEAVPQIASAPPPSAHPEAAPRAAAQPAPDADRSPAPARRTQPDPSPAPAFHVERTSWHPLPEKRRAWLRADGDENATELGEGDRFDGMRVIAIEPSAVRFDADGREVRRRIGE